jgi:hypothetical protein
MLLTPKCMTRGCVHFQGVKVDDNAETNERPVCRAFPDGIPVEISYGENLHLEPVEGDHGIVFKKESQ